MTEHNNCGDLRMCVCVCNLALLQLKDILYKVVIPHLHSLHFTADAKMSLLHEAEQVTSQRHPGSGKAQISLRQVKSGLFIEYI